MLVDIEFFILQFEVCLFVFYGRFRGHKKHQNTKQTISTLLEVFARGKNCCLCCLVFPCFCFVGWFLIFGVDVLFCARDLFVKKKIITNRLEIVLITSLFYTAVMYFTMLLLIFTLSLRGKPNDYKIVDGKNLTTTLRNQLDRFMTIFSNFFNPGITSHSKTKALRYFRLKSSAH